MTTRIDLHIVPLDEITPADEPRAGGKAYGCARLKRAGFRVPDGLVVLSTATDNDLAALTTHPWFDRLPADTVFAVRSSGIGEDSSGQSFAGVHQTLLNVRRAEVSGAVASCRTSARSSRALEYRRAKGITTDAIEMGVLIQRMIQPVAAGVAFTVNPVTGAGNELVINSSWGLGESLVSGQVDPDEFVVRKSDRELMWRRLGEKATGDRSTTFSLTDRQVGELATILIDIEHHSGAPARERSGVEGSPRATEPGSGAEPRSGLDVEWCHDGTDFWMVQSRPVTSGPPPAGEIEWTRANLAEVLPDITSPQALYAFEDLLNRAERRYFGNLMAPEHVLGPMLRSFCGRLYFNLSQLRRVCAVGGLAPALMLRSMGHADAIHPSDEQPPHMPLRERLSAVPDLLRILLGHLRIGHIVRTHEARTRAVLARLTASDPHRLTDGEIWSVMEGWLRDAPVHMQTVLLLGGVLFHEVPVRKLCDKVGFPFERLVYPQLAVGERSVSAQQAFDLIALADAARLEPAASRYLSDETSDLSQFRVALRGTSFLAELERFLQTYGHRGRYESDWSLPRYQEDPSPLLHALRRHVTGDSVRSAAETARRQERESEEAWAAFVQRLSPWQRWTVLPRIRRSIRKIKQYYVWRERVRSDMVRVLATLRTWHLVLAGRFVERGWLDRRDDYFLIRLEELALVIEGRTGPAALRATATDRTLETMRHRAIQMPLLMRESELAWLIRTAGVSSRSEDDSRLSGFPVSGGCVEAEVVVVRDPGDFGQMKPGAILVAPATDPSWTPLFTLASGVIVEVGGVLSHASTIAREYGLPALANVKHATRRLKTGERVRLDAVHGVVHKLQD